MTDERIELMVSNVLRVGVLISVVIVTTGGFIQLARYHTAPLSYADFHPETGNLRTIAGIWTSALDLDGRALIQLGLLVLIATPIARVAIAAAGFAAGRDWLYVAISSVVLAILIYSIAHAL